MNLPPFELTGDPLPRPYKRPLETDPPPAPPADRKSSLVPPERRVEIQDGVLLTSKTLAGETPCMPFRHSGWAQDRARVLAALTDSGQPANRLASFSDCGRSFWVLQDRASPYDLKIVPHRCHDRFCEPCGHERVEDIRRNLSERLSEHPHRFLTLTIASTSEPLSELLTHLLESFRRLRQGKWWKEHVSGGAAFLEIKYNPARKRWHPHLHIVCTGKFMPQKVLSEQWKVASRGSYIVDIRLVRSRHELLQYATKYVTKPLPKSVRFQPALLRECIVALKGKRLIITFGSWAKWQLTARNTEGDWDCLGQLHTLQSKAYAGDEDAADAISILYQVAALNDDRTTPTQPDT